MQAVGMKNANVRKSKASNIAVCALASLAWLLPARAQVEMTQSLTMPVRIQAAMGVSGCDNSPGPKITLSGSITLGGLTAEMIFRNNQSGTHTLVIQNTVSSVAVPANDAIVIPKQPVLGGVAGNPWIWVQMA